jgi:restriction system protein
MPLWLVRAGSHGEQEQGALEHNVAIIGWNEMPDISKINDKEKIKEALLICLKTIKIGHKEP